LNITSLGYCKSTLEKGGIFKMMMKAIKRKKVLGFTLIELMVVVAIISILSAVAIPNFVKFQTKARQSEAKVNLKGAYLAVKSKYAEKQNYALLYHFVTSAGGYYTGFTPESNTKYNYVGNGTNDKKDCTATNCDKTSNLVAGAASCTTTSKGVSANASQFAYIAWGQIDTDTFIDVWAIDGSNNLRNGNAQSAGVLDINEVCNDVFF
jgi:type IV pilus assembly protein PilA